MTNSNSPRHYSQRERQIIAALLEAKAVKDIARDLDLSVNTVKDYLKTIYRKAEVHSARELMVQMRNSAAPAADSGLAQLLQAAQGLQAEALPRERALQLAMAVRRCTRARRVSFWRLVAGPGEPYLAGESGGTLRVGTFARRLLDHGWARLETAEAHSPDGRQLAAAGLHGEVIGVQCALAPRVRYMLAGDAAEGVMGSFDLATACLLARLAQSGGEPRRDALVVSA